MFARRDKKPTPEQRLAQMRQDALVYADDAIAKTAGAQNVADYFLTLKEAQERLQAARDVTLDHALRSADNKRFWSAFGVNTPLVAGLLLLEPVTGTMAALTTVLMGYAPTTLLKRMLDDHKVGDAKAIKAVMMDIETIDIAATRVQARCNEVQTQHLDTLLRTPQKHPLMQNYPGLAAQFEKAAQKRAEDQRLLARAARHAKAAPPSPPVRRFGL